MSFHVHARRVRRADLKIGSRLSAFRSCVQLYRWLIGCGYVETLRRFVSAFDLAEPTPERLMQAIDALETERRIFLTRLEGFQRKRVREKLRGRRTPSAADLQTLYRQDFFVTSPPRRAQ